MFVILFNILKNYIYFIIVITFVIIYIILIVLMYYIICKNKNSLSQFLLIKFVFIK